MIVFELLIAENRIIAILDDLCLRRTILRRFAPGSRLVCNDTIFPPSDRHIIESKRISRTFDPIPDSKRLIVWLQFNNQSLVTFYDRVPQRFLVLLLHLCTL